MAFLGAALSEIGKVAKKRIETKVNRKLGTSFGSSKPMPAATSEMQVAPAPGSSPRRNSARAGASSEYPEVSI